MNAHIPGGFRNYDEFDEDFDDEFDEDFDDTFEEDFEEDFDKADFNRDDDGDEDLDEATQLARFGQFLVDDDEDAPVDLVPEEDGAEEGTEEKPIKPVVSGKSPVVEDLPEDDEIIEDDPTAFVDEELLEDDDFDEEEEY